MTTTGNDTLGTRSTLNVGGKAYAYYSLDQAAAKLGDVSRLPFSMKVLLANLLRFEAGGFTVSTADVKAIVDRSEEHTSELQSLMRNSYAVFCLKNQRSGPPNTYQ